MSSPRPLALAVLETLATLGRTSAEMAFYFALSFVPFVGLTVAAAIALLPADVGEPLARTIVTQLPPEAGLDSQALDAWVGTNRRAGWLAAGLLLALWSSFRLMTAAVRALARVGAGAPLDLRQHLQSAGSALLLTALWALALLAMAFVLLIVPGLRETLVDTGWLDGGGPGVRTIVRTLALAVLLLALAASYRMVPGLGARGVRLWLGAAAATAGWLLVAEAVRRVLPSLWAGRSLYGALGGFVLFLFWSWANAWVILAGGVLAGSRLRR
jgi:membrane protein